ncbi:MAG: hypothetical protein FWE12_02340 [Oscillospiraceae bacterium]|nr:hypothetical protein [Oscillospiraceae bacterium]
MSDLEKQVLDAMPKSQKIFGNTVYWVAIWSAVGAFFVPVFILANPSNNVLNPNLIFGAIFAGASPTEVWSYSTTGGFPGAHFYLDHITKADSWAMLLIAIGCAFGLFGLIPAVIYQLRKEKDWFCATLGTIIIALIVLSVLGVLSVGG